MTEGTLMRWSEMNKKFKKKFFFWFKLNKNVKLIFLIHFWAFFLNLFWSILISISIN